jgi:hypothetical protein
VNPERVNREKNAVLRLRESPGEDLIVLSPTLSWRQFMETEILSIILGAVLPIYPILYVIHQRIGRYDEIVEEFKRLRKEHEHMKDLYHGN